MSEQPMTDGPLVHKLRAEDATSVTLVSVPPFGGAVFPEVWHVPTRVYNAILAARNDAEWTAAYEKWDHVPAAGVTLAPTPPDAPKRMTYDEWSAAESARWEAQMKAAVLSLPEMVGDPNAGGRSLVRRTEVIEALDAAALAPTPPDAPKEDERHRYGDHGWCVEQHAPTPPDALRDALERADQWVLSHRGKEHDWACPKCHPSDYIGRGDFTCAIHEAECRAALAQPKEADRE
jgi:hypothetical protein